ncbi:MAG TPA: hypothetical protein VFC33_00705 [Acidimicrobiia bacterium]|nr:hypothetical protein [Acidimicrobiia bacterium]
MDESAGAPYVGGDDHRQADAEDEILLGGEERLNAAAPLSQAGAGHAQQADQGGNDGCAAQQAGQDADRGCSATDRRAAYAHYPTHGVDLHGEQPRDAESEGDAEREVTSVEVAPVVQRESLREREGQEDAVAQRDRGRDQRERPLADVVTGDLAGQARNRAWGDARHARASRVAVVSAAHCSVRQRLR